MACDTPRSVVIVPAQELANNCQLISIEVNGDGVELSFVWPHTYEYVQVLVFLGEVLVSIGNYSWTPDSIEILLDTPGDYIVSYRYVEYSTGACPMCSHWSHAEFEYTGEAFILQEDEYKIETEAGEPIIL